MKNKKENKWFNLEKVENLCEKLNVKWYMLTVVSPNNTGKTTWMINKFFENEKKNIMTGFIVRNVLKDPQKVLSHLNKKGNYVYSSKTWEIFKKEKYKVEKGIIKKKIVEKTKKTKVGYIITLKDAGDATTKSYNFTDCNLWFQDEVGNLNQSYLEDERAIFSQFLITALRLKKAEEENFKIISFTNADDLYCYIFDFYENGEKINNEFTIKRNSKNPNLVRILWNYNPPQQFREELEGTIVDLLTDDYEHLKNISMRTKGNQNQKYYIKSPNNAKVYQNFIFENNKYTLFFDGNYYIVGKYKENSKYVDKLVNKRQGLFFSLNSWRKNDLLRWENQEIKNKIEKIFKNY